MNGVHSLDKAGKCRVRKDRAGLEQAQMRDEEELVLSREAEGLGRKRRGPGLLHLVSGGGRSPEAFAWTTPSLWNSFLSSLWRPSLSSPSHPIPKLSLVEAFPWLDYWTDISWNSAMALSFVLQLDFP